MSRKHHSPLVNMLLVLIALLTVADITVIGLCLKTPGSGSSKPGTSQKSTEGPDTPEETEPQETRPTPVSTATVLSTGDILMHSGVIATGKQEDGSYNFDSIFRYVNSYTQAADFSVANLETTLCGTDNGYRYSGNPKFNCPDAIVGSLKSAGFDLLLTANNHAADTSLVGFKRTLTTVRERGLETLGTYLSSDEQKWTIQEVNGIKIGMVCYTYSEGLSKNGYPVLNYNEVAEHGIVNSFTYDKLGDFYTEIGGYLEAMKQAGADTTLVYLHWGDEYKWSSTDAPNSTQTAMAQKLCDPHVVQPLDLLQSTQDPAHQTVILYSMGNAVSNQRKEELPKDEPTGHTEDGVLFCVTYTKYSDGSVYTDSVELIPTWVNMNSNTGKKEYNIVPLEEQQMPQWQTLYQLTDSQLSGAKASFDRTQAIVSPGLAKIQNALVRQKTDREALTIDEGA